MNRSNLWGIAAAILSILVISYVLSGAPDNASLLDRIDPVSTFNGMAFAFAYGYGLPVSLSFSAALAILLLPALGAFFLVQRLTRAQSSR